MTTAPVLALPDMKKPFIVQTDASLRAVGAALMQADEKDNRHVVAFVSKKFSEAEQRWPTHERELFGFVHAFKKWRHYLHGSSVRLEGDHKPLTWIKTQKTLTGKQARWLQTLEEIDYTVHYVPGKELVVPDAISRRPDLMNDDKTESMSLLYYLSEVAPEELKNDLENQPYLWSAVHEIALESVNNPQVVDEQRNMAHTILAMGEDIILRPSEDPWIKLETPQSPELMLPYNNSYDTTRSVLHTKQWLASTINSYIMDPFAQRIFQGEEIPNYFHQRGLIYYKDPQTEFPVLYIPSDAHEIQHSIVGSTST